jgi:hypothetical protein
MNLFASSNDMANQEAFAALMPPTEKKAGFFSGIPTAAVEAVGSTLNDFAMPLADAATPYLMPGAKKIDQLFKTDVQGYLLSEQQKTHDAMHRWTPDRETVGWLGNVVYGAGNVLGDVAVGTVTTGNPLAGVAVASGAQAYKGYRMGQFEGLDDTTAAKMGAISGFSTFLGAFLPVTVTKGMAVGLMAKGMQAEVAGATRTAGALYGAGAATATIASNTGAKIATGGLLQAATGIPTRGITAEVLNNAGYTDMAKQYEAFDIGEIASDFAIGSLFAGGIHGYEKMFHGNPPKAQPSDLAAAMALNNASHLETGTAPGIPTDPAARNAHVEAINKTIEDLLAGRPVDVGDAVTKANFIENPVAVETRNGVVNAVEDHLGADWQSLKIELENRGLPSDTTLYSITDRIRSEPIYVGSDIGKMVERATKENWPTERLITELEGLKERLDVRSANNADKRSGDRVRGPLWFTERLTRAERTGELPPEAVGLAKWLLEKNPNLAEGLGLSIRDSVDGNVGGEYEPLKKLVTLFRGAGDPLTIAHEILHHAERMMPEPVRKAINAAWLAEVRRVTRMAEQSGSLDLKLAIHDVLRANMGDSAAHARVVDMVKQGLVDMNFYQLVNPSEFWAVNASKIVRERANEGWVKQAVQWVKELIEKAKDVFGLKSDAAVIRGLDAVLKADGTLTGNQLAYGKIFPNVEQPGTNVGAANLNGFEPDLRVKVDMGDIKLPEKPLILTGTNKKNAARQIGAIDDILAKFPDADTSPLEWSKMMAYAMATDDVPVPPYRFLKDINSDGAHNNLARLSPGQISDAQHGFENAAAFREAYTAKQLDVETTGKLFMWSFLSRGVSPYTQEGLFIDGFKGAGQWIKKAADGNLTEADFPAYEAWAKSVAPQGSGQPGSGATHNLNAFGRLFLFKMGQKDENGVSLLQTMHNMMEDPNMTGQQLRRWFITNAEGVGIDNKVVSFTLLVAGFKDLMVLDRVQIRQLWDDGRFGDRNLYDGRKEEGKPVAGSALSEISYGARGLLIYEAIERALAKRIDNIYASLGRPEDASIGRYHWETWVADSQQEASHGTLDAILHDAKGDGHKIAEVTAKEGEYGAYAYGARYGRDASGTPYFLYNTPTGGEYRFTVPAFREFLAAVKSPENGVVPKKFKVTEAGNAPWYEKAEVNKQAIDTLAQRYAGEPGAGEGAGAVQKDGAGQTVPDQPGRGADPYGADVTIRNNPGLTYVMEDGTMISASRALAGADAEIAAAKRDSQGYDAAVACALRG